MIGVHPGRALAGRCRQRPTRCSTSLPIAWIDGELDVMAPDYIYNVDPDTGESTLGVGYGGYVAGEKVAIVGVKAPGPWRSERGIELIGPRHFGFDFDYVPVEELQARRQAE